MIRFPGSFPLPDLLDSATQTEFIADEADFQNEQGNGITGFALFCLKYDYQDTFQKH